MESPEQQAEAPVLQPEIEHPNFMQRTAESARAIGSSVLENMRDTGRRPLAIGASALMLAAVAAELASGSSEADNGPPANLSRTSVKPTRLMNAIIKVFDTKTDNFLLAQGKVSQYMIKPKKAFLTPSVIHIKSACPAYEDLNQGLTIKRTTIRPKSQTEEACGPYGAVNTYNPESVGEEPIHEPGKFAPPLNRLGKKSAHSVGISKSKQGSTKRIASTKQKATILYKRNPNSNTRQIKKLVLNSKGVSKKVWYQQKTIVR